MITFCPTRYWPAGRPNCLRTAATLSPPGDALGSATAMTKLGCRRAGSYQSRDDSQRWAEVACDVMGATWTLPPLITVVELACQYPARPSV
jgi:hypothetical protein